MFVHLISVIKEAKLGERVLPIEYVTAFYKKPENLSWEEFHFIMNKEFQKTQNDQLERKKQKQLQKEAEDAQKEEQR